MKSLRLPRAFADNSCSTSISVFLWMKKNAIIFLRLPPGDNAKVQGEFKDAPYLNVHGETERDLR